ncbi:hypothetical protein SLS59_004751 [Nothophoma quercina]|uniref:DUF7514 domain-containing protein n=1 Tax=Nothophoma quercina TaxID=749835 RepID=A0ABR3RF67_9PLEO
MGDMAANTHESKEQQPAENAANDEATQKEAYNYWGYLLKPDKCGTDKLDNLLKGIADVISKRFEPSDSPDLTPSQIAAWYRAVGGDYDMLFTETPPSSIAFIYRSLGAFHSLQPSANDDGYSSPAIPALKKQGFVTWQTIQLLLGPQEHVPFLQKSVEQFDVIDPETKEPFIKLLPSKCFPDKPDEAMEEWYEGVAARLKREAESEANGTRVEDEPRMSADYSGDGSSADEKTGAFKYFEDPMYRKSRSRPTFMRHVSKEQARAGNEGPISRTRTQLLSLPSHLRPNGILCTSALTHRGEKALYLPQTPTQITTNRLRDDVRQSFAIVYRMTPLFRQGSTFLQPIMSNTVPRLNISRVTGKM